ncbi:MAG TPA: hypothetical protein VFW40_02090 [Capsulimonadaceae bacterium]|nr:hypothetical protein [Capsulimonadaceae bacterium]
MRYLSALFVIGAVLATMLAGQSRERSTAAAASQVATAGKTASSKATVVEDYLSRDEQDYDDTNQKLAHDQKIVEADKLRIQQDRDAVRALLDEAGQEHITIKGTWGTYYYDAPDAPLCFQKRHLIPKWMW